MKYEILIEIFNIYAYTYILTNCNMCKIIIIISKYAFI